MYKDILHFLPNSICSASAVLVLSNILTFIKTIIDPYFFFKYYFNS